MGCEKKRGNIAKHGVDFADAVPALEDDYAITITDDESDPGEQRYATLGMNALAHIVVVVYTWRGENIRIISARPAEPHERNEYEAQL